LRQAHDADRKIVSAITRTFLGLKMVAGASRKAPSGPPEKPVGGSARKIIPSNDKKDCIFWNDSLHPTQPTQ
jgi:hypothetical protein